MTAPRPNYLLERSFGGPSERYRDTKRTDPQVAQYEHWLAEVPDAHLTEAALPRDWIYWRKDWGEKPFQLRLANAIKANGYHVMVEYKIPFPGREPGRERIPVADILAVRGEETLIIECKAARPYNHISQVQMYRRLLGRGIAILAAPATSWTVEGYGLCVESGVVPWPILTEWVPERAWR